MNDTSTKAPDETLREALAELVACKDLKIKLERAKTDHSIPTEKYLAIRDDYIRRQPLAWQAARRALATPTKPEMQPEGLVSSCQALSETAGESAQKRDAERYRWLKPRLYAVDFAYGDPPIIALVFKWPNAPVSADVDATFDAAIAVAPAERDSEGPSLLPVDPGQDEQDA